MEVDRNKLQITEKQYKKQDFLQSNDEYEKRVLAIENMLSITYDKIYHLEVKFAIKTGSNLDKRDENSNMGSNVGSYTHQNEVMRKKMTKMQ